jgi:hypothetical protein
VAEGCAWRDKAAVSAAETESSVFALEQQREVCTQLLKDTIAAKCKENGLRCMVAGLRGRLMDKSVMASGAKRSALVWAGTAAALADAATKATATAAKATAKATAIEVEYGQRMIEAKALADKAEARASKAEQRADKAVAERCAWRDKAALNASEARRSIFAHARQLALCTRLEQEVEAARQQARRQHADMKARSAVAAAEAARLVKAADARAAEAEARATAAEARAVAAEVRAAAAEARLAVIDDEDDFQDVEDDMEMQKEEETDDEEQDVEAEEDDEVEEDGQRGWRRLGGLGGRLLSLIGFTVWGGGDSSRSSWVLESESESESESEPAPVVGAQAALASSTAGLFGWVSMALRGGCSSDAVALLQVQPPRRLLPVLTVQKTKAKCD